MKHYQKKFSVGLADSGSLLFGDGLFLRDGRPTPHFINIGIYARRASSRFELAKAYASMIKQKIDEGINIDVVFGPSYKASLIAGDATFALLIDYGIDLGCCYDRKEAKTHGEEASSVESLFVGAKFYDGCNIYMVDDVGTSMATKLKSLKKISHESEASGITTNVVGVGIAVDREQVGPVYDDSKPVDLPNEERVIVGARGEDAIGSFIEKTGIPVDSIVGITGVVEHLFNTQYPLMINNVRQPMSSEVHDTFLEYMAKYGVERVREGGN